ncbi:PAS domain-containing protein [Streptomyces sp. DSM 44917]|uniref:PAS domain-containing protein n=1 Tax=Streptomyces boetiae TaxID=3075541 RepID=A0ABU2L1D5_9ACTN|nr:PAS domain-containing protein [Streptomyces sp. DSM 44917]MDT0305372.1 PAS domain-containing protein [Streptomyces sp. DSM 44917]
MTVPSKTQALNRGSAGEADGGTADGGADDARLLTALLDGMDAALFALDDQGRVTHWNRQAERLLGWTREQAVGRPGPGGWLVRAADAPAVLDQLLAVRERPEPEGAQARWAGEFAMFRQDGGRVLVRARAAAVRRADGTAAGVYCAFGEVHAQLALERNLALSEALLAGPSWGVLVVDADLRTVAVNEAAARVLSVTPADMLGEPLGGFFGAGLDELESALEHALAGQEPMGPVELSLSLLGDGEGGDHLGDAAFPPRRDRRRRTLISGFLRLAPGHGGPVPLGVAWLFRDVTRPRHAARDAARRAFRAEQLGRAARAAAECEEPMEAVALHLHYALAGFADHALLDLAGERGGLVRRTESPGPLAHGERYATPGARVRYRSGHPALQAMERALPVRATGGTGRAEWAAEHRWPKEAEHALCVPLRSRGRSLGVLTFLRGEGRRPFDRADAAYGEDVALRVAAAADLAAACGASCLAPPC